MTKPVCSVVLLVALLASPVRADEEQRPPNVVLILADDLGYADLGCQGGREIATPHIDTIAARGIRFTNGYVTCPVCAPTRAGLLTGRYQQRFGLEFNPGPPAAAASDYGLPKDEPTLAELLKHAGYVTGMVGKWHLGYRDGTTPPDRGFDEFLGFLSGANDYWRPADRNPVRRGREEVEVGDYLTDVFETEAAAFIDRHKDEPFFLYVPFNAVHSPLQAPKSDTDRFPALEGARRTFAGMLASMDDAVGCILDRLAQHRLEERTLVIFLSDNGGPTPQTTSRNDPLRGTKGQVYEGGVRIPFLIQWKGTLPAGVVEHRPVVSLDLVPTILAAAGVEPKNAKPFDGVDLLPYLQGEGKERPHDALFWRMGPQAAVRVGDWKYVRRQGKEELFDLATDVGESRDLAAAHPERLEALKEAYRIWEAGTLRARWQRGDRGGGRQGGRGRWRPESYDDLERLFRERDADGDGKLSREEFGARRLFNRLDVDRDGFVSLEEARALLTGPPPR